jgi:Uma2 family endonuclease
MATALLEKQETRQLEAAPPEAAEAEIGVAPYHWTVEALYKALNAGVFEHPERLELLQGRIIEEMSQDPAHRSTRVRLSNRFRAAFEARLLVMDECPVHLAYDSELTADLVALYGSLADYDERHPQGQDIALLVEVSNTTMNYDLGEKAMQYAQAGIADYWVVLVKDNAVVVHRQPSAEGYRDVTRLMGTDTLSPLALPSAAWTINELLGRTEASEEN